MALTGTLLVPLAAERGGSRRLYILGGGGLAAGGLVGLLLQPAAAPLWAATIGFGLGIVFPVVLTLPLDVSDSPASAGAVAGVMLGIGYGTSALAPTDSVSSGTRRARSRPACGPSSRSAGCSL